jgi:hypothetical protein
MLLCPYREPTQVPLGEKPKVCWDTPVEGTRQTSLIPLVYEVRISMRDASQ